MKYEPYSMTMSLTMNKTEMREYLTGKGLWIYDNIYGQTSTKIEWNGIRAGYLFDDDVRLFDDTHPGIARLISVPYTHPRCLERVDRIILYLKTADRRREQRMRRERAKQVRAYFEVRKNLMREIDRHIAILDAEYYSRLKESTCA
jgi:hypothetical protein